MLKQSFIQIEYSFPFLYENSALGALELVYSGGDIFKRVEIIMEFIFFSPIQSFNLFSLGGRGPYQIFWVILNFRLTVYGWHKFSASVGTTNDFFNCMPK